MINDHLKKSLGRGKKITGPTRVELRAIVHRAYVAGSSIRAICQLTGRSYGFVHTLLKENGTKLRPRGGPHRKKRPTSEEIAPST